MKKAYLKYFAGLLLFGMNGVVASYISLTSSEIVLLRSILGSLVLLLLFLISGNRFHRPERLADLCFTVLSGAAMAADWLLLFESYKRLGVSISMIINYTGPAIVVLCSPFLLKEKLTWDKLLSLAVAFSVVVFLSGDVSDGRFSASGLLCAGLSAIAYAVMVLSGKLSKTIRGFEYATLQLLSATAVVIIYMLISKGTLLIAVSGFSLLPVLLLGAVNTGLGCYFYFTSVQELPAQMVAICGYLEQISSIAASALVLGERL